MQRYVKCEIKVKEGIGSKSNGTHGQTYLTVFHDLVQTSFQVPSQDPSLIYHVGTALDVTMLPESP